MLQGVLGERAQRNKLGKRGGKKETWTQKGMGLFIGYQKRVGEGMCAPVQEEWEGCE